MPDLSSRLRAFVSLSAAGAVALACSSTPSATEPSCVTGLSTACAPQYDPPTYHTLFTKLLHPTCASGRGTCHTADAREGGLVFEDEAESYALLLGTSGGKARVSPGDPSCSLLMERVASADPNFRMPPGSTALSAGEQCSLVQWIANGAKR